MDSINENDILKMIYENLTYKEISDNLKAQYPNERGFSEMSVRRYLMKRGMKKKINQEEVNEMVKIAVSEVRPVYTNI